MKEKPPSSVTTLQWMVLLIASWSLVRAAAVVAEWDILREFAPHPGPIYYFAAASFWTLAWGALWVALRRRRVHAERLAEPAALGYTLWWWANRLLFERPHSNWPFALTVTFVLLALLAIQIYHPRTKEYYQPQRESHERKTEDSRPA